jgi:2'-5' RNA ligase
MRISVWLLPDPAAARPLAEAIDELAEGLGGPRFLPHLTLIGEVAASGTALTRGLEALSRRAPIVLATESLEVTSAYHRALFLRVRSTPALLDLREAALRALATHGGAPWMPHVSLLYGDHPAETKRPWLSRVGAWLPRTLRFDRLAAVETTGPVEGWQVRWEGPLQEPQ